MGFQQIQKYESEANTISAARLFQLAEALHVEMMYFLAGLERRQPIIERVGPSEADVDPAACAIATLPERVRNRMRKLLLEVGTDAPPQ